jgi:hypothetical protein
MTNTSPVRRPTFVSPFLLPYIQADREDVDKRAREAAESLSPDGEAMLSPMEDRSGRESLHTSHGALYRTAVASPQGDPRSPFSPKNRLSSDSPGATRRSMIERSISELTFDPDLTFMDSPGRSSAMTDQSPERLKNPNDQLNLSIPPFTSPMKTVSPDRSVVPLDESEIGFSNELRASMTTVSQVVATDSVASTEPSSKRRKVLASSSEVVSHMTHSETSVSVENTRSKRVGKSAETEVEAAVTKETPRIPRIPRRAKKNEEVELAPAPAEQIAPSSTRKRKAKEEAPLTQPEAEKAKQPSLTKTVAKSSSAAISNSSRKSPRFASKVITTRTEVPPLMLCPKCRKAYKRARDYEKHVASCK